MNTKKLTSLSLLLALSLVIFIVEARIPPLVPIPGVKIGLANIITLLVLVWYGRKEAFCVLFLRIILGSVFTGQAVSILYSLSGGILCFFMMSALLKPLGKKLWVLSILGAMAHNIGQITTAAVLTSSRTVFSYLPVLIISAVVCGLFTGLAASAVVRFGGSHEN